jgi:hypothetical protein
MKDEDIKFQNDISFVILEAANAVNGYMKNVSMKQVDRVQMEVLNNSFLIASSKEMKLFFRQGKESSGIELLKFVFEFDSANHILTLKQNDLKIGEPLLIPRIYDKRDLEILKDKLIERIVKFLINTPLAA